MKRYFVLVFIVALIISGCSSKQNKGDGALPFGNTDSDVSIADEQDQDGEDDDDANEKTQSDEYEDDDSEDVLSDEEKERLEDEMKPYEGNTQTSDQQKTDDQIMTEALKTKNKELCLQMTNEDLKKTCINNIEDMLKTASSF